MKNIIKKISTAAMALTLLFTGSAFAENTDTKAPELITAHAACSHNGYRYKSGNAVKCGICDGVVYYTCQHHGYRYRVGNAVKCGSCDQVVYYL